MADTMFTGIIRHVGRVHSVGTTAAGARLAIELGPLAQGLREGDSVAINGACLTAAAVGGERAAFDVIAETLGRTTLGSLRANSPVNLERALGVGDALDGHLVQGHVDAVAVVRRIERGGQWRIEFQVDASVTDEMVAKGSVALDGVSLTLAGVSRGRFAVALIPTTLAETTLADLRAGDRVNVETDVLGKYVRGYLRQVAGDESSQGGLTLDKLRRAGFA